MTKELIHQGKLISLYKEQVNLTNGDHTHFDIVKHPGGAVIAAINGENELCMLRQWRHAVQDTVWELPAGCLEPSEPPLQTAIRELEEEAGVRADKWEELGKIIPSPGFSNEVLYLYVAKDLQKGKQNLDDAEQLDVHWLPLQTAYAMAGSGEITDAKTLALLLRLAHR